MWYIPIIFFVASDIYRPARYDESQNCNTEHLDIPDVEALTYGRLPLTYPGPFPYRAVVNGCMSLASVRATPEKKVYMYR